MKRKIISCLILWVIIDSSFMLVSGNEYTEYTFKVYDMNKNDFLSFIENPKTEKIEQITNYKVYFIDRLKNTFPVTYAPHYHQYINNELVYTSVLDGLRLNATKIKQQLFDFCNEYDKLEKIFLENNIQCEVLNVLPFSCNKFMSCSVQIPLTLFINTNTGDYFLTLDEFVMRNINKINSLDDNEYYLHLYTPAEYYEAFKLYNGEIYVNNIKIEEDDIQFQAYECYIPLRSVMEAAGCVVKWEPETKNIMISNNERYITIKLNNDYSLEIDGYPFESVHCYYEIDNDRTIISSFEFTRLQYALGLKADYKIYNHVLSIWCAN